MQACGLMPGLLCAAMEAGEGQAGGQPAAAQQAGQGPPPAQGQPGGRSRADATRREVSPAARPAVRASFLPLWPLFIPRCLRLSC